MFPLAPGTVVLRIRKRRSETAVAEDVIASTVVPMKMRIDDDIHLERIDSSPGDQFRQRKPCDQPSVHRSVVVDADAAAGLNDDDVLSGLDHVRIQAQREPIAPVGRQNLSPALSWNYTKDSPAIRVIGPCLDRGDLHVSENHLRAAQ